MFNNLIEEIELSLAVLTIAIDTYANAFPIAPAHGERRFGCDETLAVETIIELVLVALAVVGNTQPKFLYLSTFNNALFLAVLHIDALRTDANAMEPLADAEQTRTTVAVGTEQRGALTLIAHHLLRQHVATVLQAVGRQRL